MRGAKGEFRWSKQLHHLTIAKMKLCRNGDPWQARAEKPGNLLVMDRRSLLIGAGLTALAGISYWRTPRSFIKPMTPKMFGEAIPARVGNWTSRKTSELVLPPQDDSNKLYENLETRVYEGQGLPDIMVLVAYSSIQQNDVQVHRPEVCYPASGFPIISSKPIDLVYGSQGFAAREVTADRGGLLERVIYWVRVGDSFPTSWASQRLEMAAANLKGTIPDGVLVRVSAIEGPGESVSGALRGFIRAFLDQAPAGIRNSVLL